MTTESEKKQTRVFVSSTFIDLKKHREVAVSALQNAGLVVDPMESWPADDRDAMRASVERVETSDIVVLLVARRRGFVPAGGKLSVTQLEYTEARRRNKPILVFMLKEESLWITEYDERKSDPNLEIWIKELKESHIVEYFEHEPTSLNILPAIYRLTPRLPQTSSIEREYKLSSPSNTQFKFSTIQQPEWIINRIVTVCAKCGIRCDPPVFRNICDLYYDDERRSLNNIGVSIRKRSEEQKCSITCKSSATVAEKALRRQEVEFPCDDTLSEDLDSGEIPQRIVSTFWDVMKTSLGKVGKPFGVSLAVYNQRIEIPLQTSVGRYTFCYDRYFFQSGKDYSEYFSEIEIEVVAETGEPDDRLKRLIETLTLLTDYTPEASSKYQRGVTWLRTHGDNNLVWVLGFEIIGLNAESSLDQKQALQMLSHHVKTGLLNIGYDVSALVQSPYPGGFILLFDELPSRIVDTVRYARQAIPSVVSGHESGRSFDFRAALDQGTALRYSGVTENLVISSPLLNTIGHVLEGVPINSFYVGKSAANLLGFSKPKIITLKAPVD